ncbi:MAG: aminotransferase class III-fold pyridoxal phosphate-dependent enzyme, partial [Bacteroidota bacterium]
MTDSQAANLVFEIFGIQGSATALPGEMDLNFLIRTNAEEKYVLKIESSTRALENLQLQNSALQHLEQKSLPIAFPSVMLNKSGNAVTQHTLNGQQVYIRLLTWVEGKLLANTTPHSAELMESLGTACGHVCQGLSDFQHPAAHRFFRWNSSEVKWIQSERAIFEAPEKRALIDHFLTLFETEVTPILDDLRRSVNYNDANDYNVLVGTNSRVSGLIDFGDIVYTETINEVAIAAAYAMMGKTDPIVVACQVLRGFHTVHPITEKECQALFPLIAARLLISVTVSTINQRANPENTYLQISAQAAWNLLKRLSTISPNLVHYTFRSVCGYEPCPKKAVFLDFIKKEAGQFASVVNVDLQKTSKIVLDLSVGSWELGNNPNFEEAAKFETLVNRLMEDAKVKVSIGKYCEVRPIYTSDAFTVEGNEGPQWRTLHIGLDVFMEAETSVFAPLAGKVHSFQNNVGDRDYGPTIILEHTISDDLTFYTLYGHLSVPSLDGLSVGMSVEKGQQIAAIGPRPINGDWPPHLHFQIILDMLNYVGDFPGVAFPYEKKLWESLCPNPNLIIGLTENVVGEIMPSLSDLLQLRQKHLGKNLSLSYQKPLRIQRGYLQYLYDESGRRFLDTVNNVPHVGHQHPKVVRAAQQQITVFNSNTRYLQRNLMLYAEKLCATLPKELSVCYFVNSGSEANELAMRLAKTYTGQTDFIAVEVGYHGNTQNCIDISSYKFDSPGGTGKADHIHIVPMPDTYRGIYKKDDPEAGKKYAAYIEKAIQKNWEQGKDIAGFFCESILSCGGQIVLPPKYLKHAFAHVRAAGGVCISDEVQVGFGRVGDHFWGFELQGVVPDIMTMGKPMGNGHPLGAVVTTREIADAFNNGMEYFNTFGGNPVSCAIGMAVLDVIEEEHLQANALKMGGYLQSGLRKLAQTFPIIGDVRGHGLFLGFELVKDRKTLLPAATEATYLANRMKNHGILRSTDGLHQN